MPIKRNLDNFWLIPSAFMWFNVFDCLCRPKFVTSQWKHNYLSQWSYILCSKWYDDLLSPRWLLTTCSATGNAANIFMLQMFLFAFLCTFCGIVCSNTCYIGSLVLGSLLSIRHVYILKLNSLQSRSLHLVMCNDSQHLCGLHSWYKY